VDRQKQDHEHQHHLQAVRLLRTRWIALRRVLGVRLWGEEEDEDEEE